MFGFFKKKNRKPSHCQGITPFPNEEKGIFPFIKAEDITVGDTIAWHTAHPKYPLNYMTVEDIEEGEDNFKFYNSRGQSVVDDNNYYPVIVLRGKVMCCDGIRKFPNGYHMTFANNHTPSIMLLRRKIGEKNE